MASVPDGVIGICYNPSGCTMALGSTQPPTEFQEYFVGGKAAGESGRQPCHLHVPIVLESSRLNLLEPSGPD